MILLDKRASLESRIVAYKVHAVLVRFRDIPFKSLFDLEEELVQQNRCRKVLLQFGYYLACLFPLSVGDERGYGFHSLVKHASGRGRKGDQKR